MSEDHKINPLQSVLNTLPTPQNSERHSIPFKLATHWTTIVGKELLNHTSPLSYANGVITIGVRDPVLMFQCRAQTQEWIQKLNHFLGLEKIEKVRFKLI